MENTFPIGILPEKIRNIVKDVCEERKYPLDYTAAAVLWVMSVLVGSCTCLRTTLGITYANIYLMLVGAQGANKSAPMAWATEYLHTLDHQALDRFDEQYKEYEEAIKRGEHLSRPVAHRYLADASTPEALFRILRENPKGVGQCADEIAKAFKDLGRYARSRDDETYLRLFNGQTMTIDRVSRPDVLHVSRPYFCFAGTIQPATFNRIFTKDRVENGLLARFVEVVHFEEKAMLWNLTEDLPGDADERYASFISMMIEWRSSVDIEQPIVYHLSEDAADVIQEWQNAHEIRISTSGREIDRAIFRKIQLYVLKFALLLQVLTDVDEGTVATDPKVDLISANFATLLADYFFANAKDLARSVYVRRLSDREKVVFDALPEEFDTEIGLQIARSKGLGKTCFFDLISKIMGVLIDRPYHGHYAKRHGIRVT